MPPIADSIQSSRLGELSKQPSFHHEESKEPPVVRFNYPEHENLRRGAERPPEVQPQFNIGMNLQLQERELQLRGDIEVPTNHLRQISEMNEGPFSQSEQSVTSEQK
mmetsp:Transcript_36625/g.56187  ORF Transcript_36625/g.56187 Transcript_36625/m.56187 type:complete len:107 (-) Transcript_36625:658-978(-)